MALNIPKLATFLSILLPIWAFSFYSGSASSSHAAPSPSVDCSNLVTNNLIECLSFVTPGSTIKKPQGSCCNGLKTVLKTNADCLCEGFKNSAALPLNVTKALTLPSVCHLSAPSFSNCGLSLVPGAAPALSPMPSSPIGAPSTSIGGSEVSPALPPGISSGSVGLSGFAASLVMALIVGASLAL